MVVFASTPEEKKRFEQKKDQDKAVTERIADAVEGIVEELKKLGILLRER